MTVRRTLLGAMRWFARRLLLWLVRLIVQLVRTARQSQPPEYEKEVCIESGTVGFTLIDVQEVERSACEYFGRESVSRSVVSNRSRYLRNARTALGANCPRFYWVDPRSGSQHSLRGPLQSVGLALLLAWKGVTPIVWLTDLPVRRWRLQAEILSVGAGVGFILEHPSVPSVELAHRNFIGPTPMPISAETLNRLSALAPESPRTQPKAVFVGSLYEPRTTIIRTVQRKLGQRGYHLEVQARELGGPRISDEEYWGRLAAADVVFTTAAQVGGSRGIDRTDSPHLVYRYTEALAAGVALVAPHVPQSEHVFMPGTHYAAYRSEAEALELLVGLLSDEKRRSTMGQAGRARVKELQRTSSVWILAEQHASRRKEPRIFLRSSARKTRRLRR